MYRFLSIFLFLSMLAFPGFNYAAESSLGTNNQQTEEVAKRDSKHGRHGGHGHHNRHHSWNKHHRGHNYYPYYRNNAYFYRGYNTYPYYYNTYPYYYYDTYDSNPNGLYFYWGF